MAPAILVYGPPDVGDDFHWNEIPVTPVVNPPRVRVTLVPAQITAEGPEMDPGEGTPVQGNTQDLFSVNAPELVLNPVTST